MNSLPLITAEHLSKKFVLHDEKTMLAKIVKWLQEKKPCTISALRDVSLNVTNSEVVGLVGRNGSGKSTLLRILAGIYKPTTGSVRTYGRIVSLFRLTMGMHTRLSMRNNIYLLCAMIGLLPSEIRAVYDDIVSFSELKQYERIQVYQFSSGMMQRLSFSIAVHSSPDILILDEVFAAGDAAFRTKSRERMQQLVGGDVSVVIATHDMNLARQVCDRVLWMQEGSICQQGDPDQVINAYLKFCSTL